MQRPGTALATPLQGEVTADLWPHPLTAVGRATRVRTVAPGATLASLVAAEWPGASKDTIAAVDGCIVPASAWVRTPLAGGEIVTLRAAARGGGDSDPLRTVLTIAVVVAAIWAGPELGLALHLEGTLAAQVGGAIISLAGGLIINALVPPRPPELPTTPAARRVEPPVYSISGGTNRARAYEPLLLVLGRHRVFPDLAAAEYTEFAAGPGGATKQYLYQIFHFGLGDLEIDELRIGDTPLTDFDEVETQWSVDGAPIALVAGNVDSEPGAALGDTDWVERVTGAGATRIGIDLAGRLFRIDEQGNYIAHAVDIEIEYWPEGDETGKRSHTVRLVHGTPSPFRRTLAYGLDSHGTHVVRVRRTGAPSTSERVHDELSWTALRSYQPDRADYKGQTRLALKIRATGQLSGRLDRLSATVHQKIPVWDVAAAAWSAPQASSNPAWLFRWYARGVTIDGRLAAGAGLSEARIDEPSIAAWGAWCDDEGLACDYVIDRTLSHADVLTLIARCGRASPTWQTGRLGVVWDAPDTPASALVTPGNIVAGSFGIEYAANRAAEEIVCRYIDPKLDWQYNSVRRTVPGAPRAPAGSTTLTLAGVTTGAQAAAECNLQAARQVYHRRRMRWEMGAEGLMAIARGDVVHLTHSLIDGGSSGRLAGGTTGRLTLDRPVALSGRGDYLLLRLADGALHTSAVAHTDGAGTPGETAAVVLETPLDDAPDAWGADPLDTVWRFYGASGPPAKARIVAVVPVSEDRVRLEAIDEVDAYYTAATENLDVPLPAPRRHTPGCSTSRSPRP